MSRNSNLTLFAILGALAARSDFGQQETAASPADEFIAAFSQHCGQAYAGRVISNEPPVADDPFENQALVMHVGQGQPDELRIPFHVGEDHSRIRSR